MSCCLCEKFTCADLINISKEWFTKAYGSCFDNVRIRINNMKALPPGFYSGDYKTTTNPICDKCIISLHLKGSITIFAFCNYKKEKSETDLQNLLSYEKPVA